MLRNSEHKPPYSISLLLSTASRKNFESLGNENNLSGDTIRRLLAIEAPTLPELIEVAKKILKRKRLYLLLDDTLILKIYSRCIEGTSDNYSTTARAKQRSLCSIVAMLTDGEIAIPIDQLLWTAEEVDPINYATKTELAQIIIARVQSQVSLELTIMDGLYATEKMIRWLNKRKLLFEMRFHANRVIEKNGQEYSLKEAPFFRLNGYRTMRTIVAMWHGISLYFTALRRVMRNGIITIVFQVSNYKASARKHVLHYRYRWNIEKFFRTAKQYLGLNDCQSRKLELQINHILNVFVAYTIAQFEHIKSKTKNVESAIKSIKKRSLVDSNYAKMRFTQIFFNV